MVLGYYFSIISLSYFFVIVTLNATTVLFIARFSLQYRTAVIFFDKKRKKYYNNIESIKQN